jgi:DNA-binding NtrC family response regulator
VQGKHILYIDDDDGVLRAMAQLLERAGFRVSAYSDGHKALEAARADPGQYDLVVTDYSMPRISGIEVASAIMKMRADLPVVMLTGYATEALTEEAAAIGVREVISKPSSFDELMESISRLVQAT